MKNSIRSRVIVRPGGIGDGLLLAPCLESLRSDPDVRIFLVGYPDRLGLLTQAGLADGVFSLDYWLDCPECLLSGIGSSPQVRVDSFYPDVPSELNDEVNVRVHSSKPREDSTRHAVLFLADCLETPVPPGPDSPLSSLIGNAANNRFRTLWIHPGAGDVGKRWPVENFFRLTKRILRENAWSPVFIVGEAEEDLTKEIESAGYQLSRPQSLKELISEWKTCDAYIGADSGPTHLAGLTGLKTLVVFGPTNPVIWRPWGAHAHFVAPQAGAAWPRFESVWNALLGILGDSKNNPVNESNPR